MPGFNQNGPLGQGPMTGRGLGRCADARWQTNAKASKPASIQEQDTTAIGNRGMGLGRGGRCWGIGRQARFGGCR